MAAKKNPAPQQPHHDDDDEMFHWVTVEVGVTIGLTVLALIWVVKAMPLPWTPAYAEIVGPGDLVGLAAVLAAGTLVNCIETSDAYRHLLHDNEARWLRRVTSVFGIYATLFLASCYIFIKLTVLKYQTGQNPGVRQACYCKTALLSIAVCILTIIFCAAVRIKNQRIREKHA